MADRGAFGKMLGADYEQVYNAIMTDVTQVGLAVSQLTVERKIRIMGALAGSITGNREKNLIVASSVYSTGEMVRNSHFMPIFVKANLLLMRHFKNRNMAKLDNLKEQLVHFYGPYEMLTTIMEAALQKFDIYFNQWHTLTTMGLRPPDRREDETTYLAADEMALEAAGWDQERAKSKREEMPASIPDFRTAFAEARVIAQSFAELGLADTPLPDVESLIKRVADLTGELEALKKEKKGTTVTADAGT